MRRTGFLSVLSSTLALTAPVAGAGVDLQMSLYADGAGPDQVAGYAVNDVAHFVLYAEMSGGAMPALLEFTADLVPFSSCGGFDSQVISFEWGDWAFDSVIPKFDLAALEGGSASTIPLPGIIDPTNPLEVCRFDVQFLGGPERLVYRAVPTGADGSAFKVVEDASVPFGAPVSFDESVFRSVFVVAIGGPGPGGPCTQADVAEPFGVLDLADIQRFIQLFTSQNCNADFRPPWAVFDLADVQAFASSFLNGCD